MFLCIYWGFRFVPLIDKRNICTNFVKVLINILSSKLYIIIICFSFAVMNKKNKLPFNLRKYRKQAGLNQTQLAQQTGLSRAAISDFERGEYEPSSTNLHLIAKVLSVSMDNLYSDS